VTLSPAVLFSRFLGLFNAPWRQTRLGPAIRLESHHLPWVSGTAPGENRRRHRDPDAAIHHGNRRPSRAEAACARCQRTLCGTWDLGWPRSRCIAIL
jgi:hypothetical protein